MPNLGTRGVGGCNIHHKKTIHRQVDMKYGSDDRLVFGKNAVETFTFASVLWPGKAIFQFYVQNNSP